MRESSNLLPEPPQVQSLNLKETGCFPFEPKINFVCPVQQLKGIAVILCKTSDWDWPFMTTLFELVFVCSITTCCPSCAVFVGDYYYESLFMMICKPILSFMTVCDIRVAV